jgi:hypothetical protein
MRKIWLSGCLFVLAIVLQVNGKTISVDDDNPADFNNIQAAINYSDNGDTILVADGTYRGNGNRDVDFKGKAITLRSQNGPANCIIDCQGSDSDQHLGFYFHGGEGPDSVLDGLTITGGYHEQAGAILCTYVHIKDPRPSNPTIINCVITNNRGTYAGAIRCNSHCEPLISNCVISDNIGGYTGGVSYADECRPVISSCIVRGNSGQSGGGIRTGGARCHGTISNCLIIGNRSTTGGAGVDWWAWGGSVTITNCTITDNVGWGGIGIGGGGNPTGVITNCIVRGNRWEESSFQISLFEMTPEVTYCDVEGGWPGIGNIDADPLFVDADGLDNVMGTADDNLRLLGGSPCLDAGNNLAVPPSLTADLDGNPRIINGTVDMGAYEGPKQGLVVIPQSLVVPEGGTNTFTVTLGLDPAGTVQVSVAVESGDADITVKSGATLVFDSSNYWQPQTVTLAAAEDEDYLNGAALVSVSAPAFSTVAVNVTESENDHILYVDADAPGANNGASWTNAFKNLQDALAAAAVNPHVTEIRVAQGTYEPDQGAGQTPGNREAAFGLVNGVVIRGGYAGFGEPNPDARDIVNYETILSGDLNRDDAAVTDPCGLLVEPTRAENSYHVVLWEGAVPHNFNFKENTGLDGFTVTGGNANGEPSWSSAAAGGGICAYDGGNPMVSKCRIVGNTAESGGGVWGSSCVLVGCVITGNAASTGGGLGNCQGPIKNSTIRNNFAGHAGGGVATYGDDHFENCEIVDNIASVYGGGIYNEVGDPILSNCIVKGNSAVFAGGMYNRAFDGYAEPVLVGCNFSQNLAKQDGGGMYNDYSWPTLINCIFSSNSAAQTGGGVANRDGSDVRMVNCTFVGNSAGKGRAVSFDSDEPPHQYPSDAELRNCILWDGGDEIFNGDGSKISITYSDVQDGWADEGNLNKDPCFADPINNDYHLKSQAGRWDANDGRWTIDEVTSPCIDAGDPFSPIGLEPFPNGGIVNMGAYGGTAEASKSYFNKPPCELIVAGDINGDCEIDFRDFFFVALHWLEDYNQ